MPDYPEALSRLPAEKWGERPSLKDFGAKGDLLYFAASVAAGSPLVKAIFLARTGTVTITGQAVVGTGTNFLAEIQVGQFINIGANYGLVQAVIDGTHLTLAATFGASPVAQPFFAGTGFNAATDTGKRMVIYGGGAVADRESFLTGSADGIGTVDAFTPNAGIDTQNATQVKFAANSFANDITWQVFGANLLDYSDEVSVYGPVDVVALAASDLYLPGAPTKRYYRAKVKNKTAGQTATGYVTSVALGRMTGATVLSIQNPGQCTIDKNASSNRDSAYAYFGTDDTVAIQLAMDVLTSRVPPGTADGGTAVEAAAQGKYLVGAPINHRPGVIVKGHSGGGAIFQVDGEAFPINTPIWNMTGTFPADGRIAFFTRLEDVRIDCGHVPGSIGIYCDALQENSGLYRTTVTQWAKYGVQACTATDQFGCVNWKIEDPWIYASLTAFADDSVRAFISNFALYTSFYRGTYIGQGGFICGYGKGMDISNGTANILGQVHFESARIGIHFNSGSGGLVDGMTTQSFVQTGVQIEGGNPVSLRSISGLGKMTLNDPGNGYASAGFLPGYQSSQINNPFVLGAGLQMGTNNSAPNVVTWNPLNFAQDTQGGWFSVNSRADGFPRWAKTSSAASNLAMFLRLAAQAFEVRIGNATQPSYVAQGICNVAGTAVSWQSGDMFNPAWVAGSQIVLNGLPVLIASVGDTNNLTLQVSAGALTGATFGVSTDTTAFGGTDPGKSWLRVQKDIGLQTPRTWFANGSEMEWGNTLGAFRARWTQEDAGQQNLKLFRSADSGATWTELLRFDLSGILNIMGLTTLTGGAQLPSGTVGQFVRLDAALKFITGLVDLNSGDIGSSVLQVPHGGHGGTTAAAARSNLGITAILATMQALIDANTANISALSSGKADHNTYSVVGGGGGSVTI